jgi:TolB-like protein
LLYSFADCTLNTDQRELRRNGDLIAVTPQVFDLLVYLIRNRERVVSKDDLISAIWKGRIVSESALTTRINGVRCAIGDSGEEQRLIRTLARKGIRFVGVVHEEREPAPMIAGFAEQPEQAPADPDRPSIAILPFSNIGGDPEQEYFADGMVEEIIAALSRTRWLFVIARNSSFTYKGQAVDVKQVGRELGVRYVLEGSVRKAAGRVRITGQLIDAATGAHLWADRFDGSLEDVFDLQDKVAVSVAGVIEPTLQAAEIRRSSERPTSDLTAYDLRLRAIPHVLSRDRERLTLARGLLEDAIARDPHYGAALAWAAVVRSQLDINGWIEDREACGCEAIELAGRAIQTAPDDPEALCLAAFTFGWSGSEYTDTAMTVVERSLTLSPSRAHSWLVSGWIRLWAGQPESAIEHLNTSLRLNPRGPRPMHTLGIGVAHFLSRQFDDALPMLHASNQELPNFGETYRFLAASYAHLGRLDQAQEMMERLRTVSPALVGRDAAPWRNPEHRELLLSGLRLATGATQ